MPWDRRPGTRRDLPPGWAGLRDACKRRAGGRCEWILPSGARCPRPGNEADHYGRPDEHNKLRWLCPDHHKMHTARQAVEARRKGGSPAPAPRRHSGSLR